MVLICVVVLTFAGPSVCILWSWCRERYYCPFALCGNSAEELEQRRVDEYGILANPGQLLLEQARTAPVATAAAPTPAAETTATAERDQPGPDVARRGRFRTARPPGGNGAPPPRRDGAATNTIFPLTFDYDTIDGAATNTVTFNYDSSDGTTQLTETQLAEIAAVIHDATDQLLEPNDFVVYFDEETGNFQARAEAGAAAAGSTPVRTQAEDRASPPPPPRLPSFSMPLYAPAPAPEHHHRRRRLVLRCRICWPGRSRTPGPPPQPPAAPPPRPWSHARAGWWGTTQTAPAPFLRAHGPGPRPCWARPAPARSLRARVAAHARRRSRPSQRRTGRKPTPPTRWVSDHACSTLRVVAFVSVRTGAYPAAGLRTTTSWAAARRRARPRLPGGPPKTTQKTPTPKRRTGAPRNQTPQTARARHVTTTCVRACAAAALECLPQCWKLHPMPMPMLTRARTPPFSTHHSRAHTAPHAAARVELWLVHLCDQLTRARRGRDQLAKL